MRKAEIKQQKLVYGLDIGTRSIVGTVGYMEKDRFVVVAQRVREHETRSMIDGQIHDIGAVGESIREVTEQLEAEIRQELKQACIAAAGRVLQTVTTHVDVELEGEKVITKEDIFALDSYGVEKAYEEFQEQNELDMKFYCVGYTVMRYYMNDYPMGNLENHKAKTIAADLIATFLPDDVVDGLYKAVELAGLEVANLTLEPIAAMEVAIPQMYRMLNIALIDVGAGTSDISVTKDGSIVAYGMLPIAGDCMTEDIARHCLVDFATAEQIKRGIEKNDVVEYKDIMGIPQKIAKEEVLSVVNAHLTDMAQQAADKIMELNGGKAVSAVFVVGGGGKIEGYTDIVADRLGIARERCALRGEEVMQKIDFLTEGITRDSMLVTPIGICLNFYEQSNNFMFVTFNGQRIKLYDNNRLAVVDAAIQAEYPNENLFPKKAEPLIFTVNGKQRVISGGRGESAVITVNGDPADIHTPIRANDVIAVEESTAGEPAHMQLGKLAEYRDSITAFVNGMKITLPKFASVNRNLESPNYEICQNDAIELVGYYTVEQITEVMDVQLDASMEIRVNGAAADMETKVYDNFNVKWELAKEERHAEESSEEELSEEELSGDETETEDESEDWSKEEAVTGGADSIAPVISGSTADETRSKEMPDESEKQTALQTERKANVSHAEKSTENGAGKPAPKMSLLEKAKASAERIANEPASKEVEEEMKKLRAYEAAQRISAFATAYNQTGELPKVSKPKLTFGMKKPAQPKQDADMTAAVKAVAGNAEAGNAATGRMSEASEPIKAKAPQKEAAETVKTEGTDGESRKSADAAKAEETAKTEGSTKIEEGEKPEASMQAEVPAESTLDRKEEPAAQAELTAAHDAKEIAVSEVKEITAPETKESIVQEAETKIEEKQESGLEPETAQEAAETPRKKEQIPAPDGSVTVTVNGDPVVLTGKKEYVFVDVFDRIDFDLSKPKGSAVETIINGRKAQYMEVLKTGDELEIFWRD